MIFLIGAAGTAVAALPAFAATLRGPPLERLLALQVLSADVALLFAVLAGSSRAAYDLDLALSVALLSLLGSLALLRLAGRWR